MIPAPIQDRDFFILVPYAFIDYFCEVEGRQP